MGRNINNIKNVEKNRKGGVRQFFLSFFILSIDQRVKNEE